MFSQMELMKAGASADDAYRRVQDEQKRSASVRALEDESARQQVRPTSPRPDCHTPRTRPVHLARTCPRRAPLKSLLGAPTCPPTTTPLSSLPHPPSRNLPCTHPCTYPSTHPAHTRAQTQTHAHFTCHLPPPSSSSLHPPPSILFFAHASFTGACNGRYSSE